MTQSSLKRKMTAREIATQSVRRKASTVVKRGISTNPFSLIVANETTSSKQKAKLIQNLLTGENALENVKLLENYKAELQEQRKLDNQAVIDLTDDAVFSQLKDVIESMHKGVMDFRDQLAPFTEIVTALNTMRMNGVTAGVLQEIIREKEEHDKRQEEINSLNSEIERINSENNYYAEKNIELGNDKILWLGPVKKSSQDQIGKNIRNTEINSEKVIEIQSKVEELNNFKAPDSKFEEFIEEKNKLRSLLDISSDKHQENQQRLIGTARDFVVNSDEQMKGVLGKFSSMTNQLDKLQKSNYHHGTVYSVIDEAQSNSLKLNKKNLEQIRSLAPQTDEEKEAETQVEALDRQRKEKDIAVLYDTLYSSKTDTSRVSGELMRSQANIDQAVKSNKQQFEKAKRIQSSGIAGTANGLSTVLQAVNRAAISETSESAQIAIDEINKIAMGVLQDEAISSAEENRQISDDLEKAFNELSEYNETFQAAAQINKEAFEDINAGTDELKSKIEQFRDTLQENRSVAADAAVSVE